jgi:hypothetical protein
MAKSIKEMTAAEYDAFLREHPEEAKKMDEPVTQKLTGKPQAFFKNGVLVEQVDNSQVASNGVIR